MSTEMVMPPKHLILCRLFLLLPPIPPRIRVFSSESVLHIMWPKNGSFSFSNSPSNENSGLISFRIDWFELLAVQRTQESSPGPPSVLQCSAFFMIQLSHSYMTTGKTKALTIWTYIGKVTYLVFNTLSRFIIAFLSRSKEQILFSWTPKLLQP